MRWRQWDFHPKKSKHKILWNKLFSNVFTNDFVKKIKANDIRRGKTEIIWIPRGTGKTAKLFPKYVQHNEKKAFLW